jgi:ornithine decarboxylase
VRYRDYTLRELCQEMHDLYVSFDVKSLQKRCSVNGASRGW